MYLPSLFREDRIKVQHELIRAHPLGLLVTAGPGGLMANPIPFLIDRDATPYGTLHAHFSRANPQLRELAAVDECLVLFQGPQDYVTPSWYPTKQETGKVVPTWNYAMVHAWGRPTLIEDAAWLRRQLDDLTLLQEGGRPTPWAVDDAPAPFVAAQLKGIIGLEIPVSRIEGKWKMSQNRPRADQLGVVAGFRAQGEAGEPLADLVVERNELT
jgi:transcriptional regulator